MKTQNIIGAILIVFGTVILWLFTEFGFGDFAAYAGIAIADSMVFILVLLLFLAITPLRKKTALILVIGIVWFGSTAILSFDLYRNGVKEREAGHAILKLSDTFSSGKEISQTADNSNTEPLVEMMKNYLFRVQKIRLEFSNEVNAAGLENALAPENLTNIQITKQSLAKVTNLETSVSKLESKLLEELGRIELELSQSKDNNSQEAYKGFLKSKNDGIMQAKKLCEVERNMLNTIASLLSLAIEKSDKIQLQDGKLLFEEQESLDLYNSLLEKLSSLSQQEEDVVNYSQQHIENSKTQINKILQ
jgi:hypothetical protein